MISGNMSSMRSMDHSSAIVLIKNSTYIAAFLASVEWLGFHPQTLAIFTFLMIIDIITGIARSAMVDGAKTVSSSALRDGVLKKALLLTALFTIGLAGQGVGFDLSLYIQASVTVLMLAEMYSILGNIHSARTGKKKVEFDAVSVLLDELQKIIKRFVP